MGDVIYNDKWNNIKNPTKDMINHKNVESDGYFLISISSIIFLCSISFIGNHKDAMVFVANQCH